MFLSDHYFYEFEHHRHSHTETEEKVGRVKSSENEQMIKYPRPSGKRALNEGYQYCNRI